MHFGDILKYEGFYTGCFLSNLKFCTDIIQVLRNVKFFFWHCQKFVGIAIYDPNYEKLAILTQNFFVLGTPLRGLAVPQQSSSTHVRLAPA